MSRMTNGRIRTKSVRNAFTEQSPYHKHGKRKSFTHSQDDTDIAYRSAPEYLRQLMNTSTLSNGSSTRSTTRRYSASEMTPRNLGNPKYKAQEDYYDEVQLLKKELKFSKDDNSNLRARIRRLEEDNARKSREIDGLYDIKDGDLRRTLANNSTIPMNSVVMNLKQRLFKLESQLKQKETAIDEMKNDPRWTKGTELEIQNRALFNEIEKQKFERLHFIQHDYMAAIDEEKTNAVRKLEGEKRELKIENENLKKKLADQDEESTARKRDDSTTREYRRKINELKTACRTLENDVEQLQDDLKQMRRERDKYRDRFTNIREDFEETKRQCDQYRHKLERINELDEGRHQTGRSSPALKRSDEHLNKRSQYGTLHRDSHSPEEHWKKDSRPTTPIRKSNEHMNSRSSLMSKKSSQNYFRPKNWTIDDEYRVEKFRKKHAATVIQRGWRKHDRSRKIKHDSFEKRNLRHSGIGSPRDSQQKLGSKIDNFGSGSIKNRPFSANASNESALKTVQAALRGYVNRNELDKTSRTPRIQRNDDDFISIPSRQYESERKRDNFFNQSKQNFGDYSGLRNDKIGPHNRDSVAKLRRTPSPSNDNYRPSSPHVASSIGSKQNLSNDRHTGNRFAINDRETHRTSSSPSDVHRSASLYNTGSKQSLVNDKNKYSSNNRLERETSFRKTPPLKKMSHDDDDDILGF